MLKIILRRYIIKKFCGNLYLYFQIVSSKYEKEVLRMVGGGLWEGKEPVLSELVLLLSLVYCVFLTVTLMRRSILSSLLMFGV